MKQIVLTAALALAAAAGGCASETPYLDSRLGKSVEHMVQAQTYDPAASASPPALAPEAGDGQRLKNALEAYRKDAGKSKQDVGRTIEFDAGG